MTKYIKEEWPEYQEFMEHPDFYEKCFFCSEDSSYFIPEDLYDEVTYKLQFPKKYDNTNLGTIVCYEDRAVINGNETFYYDLSDLQKGNKVLVYNYNIPDGYDRPKWIITECKACAEGLPILLTDPILNPGIDCDIIGHYNPNLPF